MSLEFLNDAFNSYFNKGIAAKEAGNIPEAKRQLLLAAETLKKIAEQSTGELKVVRQKRVLAILETVENLDKKKPAFSQNSSGGGSKSQGGGDEGSPEDDQEGLTKWVPEDVPYAKMDDTICGLENVKAAARRMIIGPINNPDVYERHNRTGGGGILMCGLPGNGKTAVARAIAAEAGCKFFLVATDQIKSKWQGVAVRNLAKLFETARKEQTAVIFFDEFDAIAKDRNKVDDGVSRELLNQLLTQMDGFKKHTCRLVVIGATNLPWELDSAINSRFRSRLEVPMPDQTVREGIIKIKIKNNPKDENLDIAEIAYKTEGYSGRDIDSLCQTAIDIVIDRELATGEKQVLTNADFDTAMLEVKSSVTENDKIRLKRYLEENK